MNVVAKYKEQQKELGTTSVKAERLIEECIADCKDKIAKMRRKNSEYVHSCHDVIHTLVYLNYVFAVYRKVLKLPHKYSEQISLISRRLKLLKRKTISSRDESRSISAGSGSWRNQMTQMTRTGNSAQIRQLHRSTATPDTKRLSDQLPF